MTRSKWNNFLPICILVSLISLPIAVRAESYECEQLNTKLKNIPLSDKQISEVLLDLSSAVEGGDVCAKNILGRLLYQGSLIAHDPQRATAIFSDLSNKGFPPSQFNLAFVLTQNPAQDPEPVVRLLQGIYIKHIDDRKYAYLALKAKELGRNYIGSLTGERNEKLLDEFESSIREATIKTAIRIRQRTTDRENRENTIVGLIMLGVAVNQVASGIAASTNYTSNSVPSVLNLPRPNLYSVYPMGQNYLYMIPH